jgi:ATP-binding cassette subfamily F protein 3
MTNKVFEFNDGVVKEYPGDINDFFEERRLSNFREVELSPQSMVNSTQKNEIVATVNKIDDKEVKQLKNKISKLEEEISIKEFDIKKIEEQIEKLSDNGKYDEQIVLQLGIEKKALEKLMQDWETLQA